MYYLESASHDPFFNLALEQIVFESFDTRHSYFMLWRNEDAIVIGKHQNALLEINTEFVKARGIHVVRRISGGGAVYHDLGNINYSFIMGKEGAARPDIAVLCRPMLDALAQLGVAATMSPRHDLLLDGKKFSGTAQYFRGGRILHHGTLLYDSDLSVLNQALAPGRIADSINSHAIASVRSQVVNIRHESTLQAPVEDFLSALRGCVCDCFELTPRPFNGDELDAAAALRASRYATWDWNYGASPHFVCERSCLLPGFGELRLELRVTHGRIQDILFSACHSCALEQALLELRGCRFRAEEMLPLLFYHVPDMTPLILASIFASDRP